MATGIVTKVCPICLANFIPKEYRAKFCSRPCYSLHVSRRFKGTGKDFWEYVTKTESCWLWTGGTTTFGYGVYRARNLTHRLSWEMHNGPIPEGLLVLHRCDTPACVRPDHLFLGTHQQNMDDANSKGRNPQGSSHGHAKLDEAAVREIRLRASQGIVQRRLAEEFGVSYATVCLIVRRQTWSHVE